LLLYNLNGEAIISLAIRKVLFPNNNKNDS
jgi:hypothetical protein